MTKRSHHQERRKLVIGPDNIRHHFQRVKFTSTERVVLGPCRMSYCRLLRGDYGGHSGQVSLGRASISKVLSAIMGVVNHRMCLLHSFLFFAAVASRPSSDRTLDDDCTSPDRHTAGCKRELELNLLPLEESLAELCLFCAVSRHCHGARVNSASHP